MAKSIMHQKDGTCYLCMLLNGDYDDHKVTEEHHAVYGTANRSRAEHWGLKVYLCVDHHRTGKEAVHRNYKIARLLQQKAQEVFERVYPELDFLAEFGRSYKVDNEASKEADQMQQSKEPGFRFIVEDE